MRGEGKGSAEDSLSGGRSPLTGPGGLSGRSASCGFAGLPFPGIALRDRGGWPAGRDGAGRGGRAIRGGSSAGLNATGGLVEESARMAPGGLFGGEDAPAAEGGARAGGARGEDRLPGRGSARGGHEGGGELVRRRRSRESDAGSGKRRLIFCPSPFAVARLPFAPPSSLPVFCARSVCPPHPSPCSFASMGRLRFFPAFSLLDRVPMRPFPGKTLSARAFRPGATRPRCERSRGVPVFHRVAGLALGNPDRSRRWIPPGPGGPKAARRPQGRVTVLVAVLVTAPGDGPRPGGGPRRGREPEGDAAASWPSNGISSGTNSGISSGTRDCSRRWPPSRRWTPPRPGTGRRRHGFLAE
jgi:hypothetical protein